MEANDVLEFWAGIGKRGWWTKSDDIDAQIHERFGELHTQACEGKLDYWAETPVSYTHLTLPTICSV